MRLEASLYRCLRVLLFVCELYISWDRTNQSDEYEFTKFHNLLKIAILLRNFWTYLSVSSEFTLEVKFFTVQLCQFNRIFNKRTFIARSVFDKISFVSVTATFWTIHLYTNIYAFHVLSTAARLCVCVCEWALYIIARIDYRTSTLDK